MASVPGSVGISALLDLPRRGQPWEQVSLTPSQPRPYVATHDAALPPKDQIISTDSGPDAIIRLLYKTGKGTAPAQKQNSAAAVRKHDTAAPSAKRPKLAELVGQAGASGPASGSLSRSALAPLQPSARQPAPAAPTPPAQTPSSAAALSSRAIFEQDALKKMPVKDLKVRRSVAQLELIHILAAAVPLKRHRPTLQQCTRA